MSYQQAVAILTAVRNGDKSATVAQITLALTLTGDLA